MPVLMSDPLGVGASFIHLHSLPSLALILGLPLIEAIIHSQE